MGLYIDIYVCTCRVRKWDGLRSGEMVTLTGELGPPSSRARYSRGQGANGTPTTRLTMLTDRR